MENLNLEKFNPKEAELRQMASIAQMIDITDLKLVTQKCKELAQVRIDITKYGKQLRDESNKFSKDVIAREKELISIIKPEEDRLKEIELTAEKEAEKQKRVALLPMRKTRLAGIGNQELISDDAILSLDTTEFETYFNQRVADHNLIISQTLAAQEAVQKKEQERLEWEAKASEREEIARKTEREKHEQEIYEAKRKEEEKIAKELADKKLADAQLAKEKDYQAFLKEIGMTKENISEFHKVETASEITVYKKVGSYLKK